MISTTEVEHNTIYAAVQHTQQLFLYHRASYFNYSSMLTPATCSIFHPPLRWITHKWAVLWPTVQMIVLTSSSLFFPLVLLVLLLSFFAFLFVSCEFDHRDHNCYQNTHTTHKSSLGHCVSRYEVWKITWKQREWCRGSVLLCLSSYTTTITLFSLHSADHFSLYSKVNVISTLLTCSISEAFIVKDDEYTNI